MVNILFVSQYLNVAGTETFMMNVLRNIDKTRFHIDFLLFSKEESSYSQEAERLGSVLYRLPNRKSGIVYYQKLNSFFKRKFKFYHVIHFCGGNVSSIAPIYFAYRYHIPVRIIHSHNSSCSGIHNKLFHVINRMFLSVLGTHCLACSQKAAYFFFRNRQYGIIKNGVDVRKYAYNEESRLLFRTNYNISEKTHVIGHIGRFEPVKNHNMILRIFEKYHELHTDSLLILIGTGILQQEMKVKVENMGLSNSVLFLGERNDIPNILCGMDCFLMPSLYEGLPFVLVEAQTSGLPCIVADTVDSNARIIPSLKFIKLNDNLLTWVTAIEDGIKETDRIKAVEYINAAGYSLVSTITFLEQVYSKNGKIGLC